MIVTVIPLCVLLTSSTSLLNSTVFGVLYCEKDELPQEMLEFMEKKGVTLVDHTVKLSYDFWNTGEF